MCKTCNISVFVVFIRAGLQLSAQRRLYLCYTDVEIVQLGNGAASISGYVTTQKPSCPWALGLYTMKTRDDCVFMRDASFLGGSAKRSRDDGSDTDLMDEDTPSSRKSTRASDGNTASTGVDKDTQKSAPHLHQEGNCIIYVSFLLSQACH